MKTTAKAKAAIEKLTPSVQWKQIVGNAAYMAWLDTETQEATNNAEIMQIIGDL